MTMDPTPISTHSEPRHLSPSDLARMQAARAAAQAWVDHVASEAT